MKAAKRQVILGALILALGAAVYLNWQFTEVVADDSTIVSAETEEEIDDDNLGVAQLVNSSYIEVGETVDDEIYVAATLDDAFSEARLTRQETRDDALEILSDILNDDSADTDTKTAAVEKSAEIAQNMVTESACENLIKAKGIEDAVVFINGDECSAMVKNIGDNTLIIQDILVSQTGLDIENITIINVE